MGVIEEILNRFVVFSSLKCKRETYHANFMSASGPHRGFEFGTQIVSNKIRWEYARDSHDHKEWEPTCLQHMSSLFFYIKITQRVYQSYV